MFLYVVAVVFLGSLCSASTIRNTNHDDHEFQCSIDVNIREECDVTTNKELECLSSGCCYSDYAYDVIKCFKQRKDTKALKCEVDISSRNDCGYGGITPSECENIGCCFEATNFAGVPWCFYANEKIVPKNEDRDSTIKLKTTLINKFKSGLDSLFEDESTSLETNSIPNTDEEVIPDWLDSLMNQISDITGGEGTGGSGNSFERPQTTPDPSVVEDEKTCRKTYELYLSVNGNYECDMYPVTRTDCVYGGLRIQKDESECTACTKLGCCYDPSMKGTGTPHCYRSRPTIVSSALPTTTTTTTTPEPTTRPRWMQAMDKLGINVEANSQGDRTRNPLSMQNRRNPWALAPNSPWNQTPNLQIPSSIPGAEFAQGSNNFGESIFNQINNKPDRGNNGNNLLSSLTPAQGNGHETDRLKSMLNSFAPPPSEGVFTNPTNTNTGDIFNALRPFQDNTNSGLSGILSALNPPSENNNVANSILSALKPNDVSNLGNNNNMLNNIFGGMNTYEDRENSNSNLASLLTSFGNGGNNVNTNTASNSLSNLLLNKFTNNNPSTGGNSKFSGLPDLASLLAGNSNRVNSASTGNTGIPNLASLLSGNSASSGTTISKPSGLPDLASLLSGNTASNIPNLASLLSGNKPQTGQSNANTASLSSLTSLFTRKPTQTGESNSNKPGIPSLASLLSGNSAKTGGSSTGTTEVSNLASLLSGNSKSSTKTAQSSISNLLSMLTGNAKKVKNGVTGSSASGNRVQPDVDTTAQPTAVPTTSTQDLFLPAAYEHLAQRKPDRLCYPKDAGTLGEMHSHRASQRIVGGQWTGGIDYWPWMASFRRNFTDDWKYKHVCGATLISNRWILTAGHCFTLYRSKAEKVVGQKETNINVFTVHLGSYYRDIAELTTQVFALENFITHPRYDFRSLKHDIAVAKLSDPAYINDYVRPSRLPIQTSMLEVGARTWVTGWGETLRVGDHNESKLKELPLPLISPNECRKHWKNHFHESWVCTEGAYLEDACTGDSGGPLVHQGYDGVWTVIGVAIAGTKRCSTDKTDIRPGIYTNVAYYREFIDIASNGACN